MRLTTYWRKPKIAKKDIVCYKYFRVIDGVLFSTYRFVKYKRGLNEAQGDPYIDSFKKFFKRATCFVYEGFIHCYTNMTQPIANATIYNTYGYKSVVYKCIIPKGAKYYISCDKKQICATQLILVENIF